MTQGAETSHAFLAAVFQSPLCETMQSRLATRAAGNPLVCFTVGLAILERRSTPRRRVTAYVYIFDCFVVVAASCATRYTTKLVHKPGALLTAYRKRRRVDIPPRLIFKAR